ncbi:MAG: hypothetical protein KY467_01140 [Gemmatimonadetes bacterium]|nr:hypothetical protein [Gemmatimonadota bacterium]
MEQNQQAGGTALAPAAQAEVEAIRRQGATAVAVQKERNQVMKALRGQKWGSVRGDNMSDETRWMIARMCELYDADPATDLDILNDRAYLKAEFYQRKLNALPNLVELPAPINIAAPYIKELREQAKRMLQDAKEFGDDDMREDALRLVRMAQHADERRAHYAVPDFATAAYEVFAVLAGESAVRAECNFAPNDPSKDPVGKARPGSTALTRAYGRLARKTVPSLRTAESLALKEGIEAEFRVIASDQQAARDVLPPQEGPQGLSIGAGEPRAARVPEPVQQRESIPVEAGTRPPANQARRARQMREEAERDEYNLTVTQEDGPLRNARLRFEHAAQERGVDPMQFAHEHLGAVPDRLTDYALLMGALEKIGNEGGEPDTPGLGL